MRPQYVFKGSIRVCYIIFLILTFKTFIHSIKFGADVLLIDDFYNLNISKDMNYVDERFTLNTEGCRIPLANENDVLKMKHFYINTDPMPCSYKRPLLTTNQTHIMFVNENFKDYGRFNIPKVECCYKSFYRPRSSSGVHNSTVDNRIQYTQCQMFNQAIEVKDEFVDVTCFYNHERLYSKFFVFTPKKPFTTFRQKPFEVNQSMYNVIVMGLGSMSRQNFYRTMPKTWRSLMEMEAVELKGYNTIATDTFHNMIAFLTGLNRTQIKQVCLPNPEATLDSCPFIWERFKDIGYFTALAEDNAKHGIFNTNTFGFRGTPTDYYIHPFIHQSEILRRRNEDNSCMGDDYYFEVLLKYIDSLTTTLNTSKLFGLFWEISMSYVNIKHPRAMDIAYATLIKKLQSSGYLKKTIVILLSDHGMNTQNGFTQQGRLELRLPLAYILLPQQFRMDFRLAYQNLRLNRDRLTTPFDLHTTLIDLLDLNDVTDDEIEERSLEPYNDQRGISLFLKVPLNRTCEMAGIKQELCSCHKIVRKSVKSALILEATAFVSHQINDLLKPYPYCLKLAIEKIVQAFELVPRYEKNVEWRSFMIIIKTVPGGGVFEVILQFKDGWILVSPIKRLNANSRNFCVRQEYIKMFCHCIQY